MVYTDSNGTLLHTSFTKGVMVNRSTMKTCPIPDHLRTHLQRYTTKQQPAERIEPITAPPGCYQTTYDVTWSDTDFLGHVNNSCYYRICCDAAAQAGMAGKLTYLHGDVGRHRIQNVVSVYENEARPGDRLDVYVWDGRIAGLSVYTVVKKGGITVCRCAIQYMPNLQPKL